MRFLFPFFLSLFPVPPPILLHVYSHDKSLETRFFDKAKIRLRVR